MATIEKYQISSGATLYRVRYRTPDNRQTDKRGFTTKRDAEAFANTVEVAKLRGEYVAPSQRRVTVGELGPAWLDRQRGHLKPSAYATMETAWRVRVQPRWGHVALGDIRPTAVQQWFSDLGRGTADVKPLGRQVVKRAHHVFSAILADAVRDHMIARNPAAGVKLPRTTRKRPVYLTHRQVAALAAAWANTRGWCYCWPTPGCGGAKRSGCGCATSTCCGGGPPCRRTPFRSARRYTSAPEGPQAAHRAAARVPAALSGPPVRGPGTRRPVVPRRRRRVPEAPAPASGWFARAVAESGVPRATPHDLRHTAASLAVSAGANVKAVQKMLGHASAAMTLEIYADLFDDDLEAVATALHDARALGKCGHGVARASQPINR